MKIRTKHRRKGGRRGMALFAAIALLAVFAVLGTAYVGYMWLEFSDAGVQLHRSRARSLAAGGVYAAIGEIQVSLAENDAPASSYQFALTTYRTEQGGPGAYPQHVDVTVSDESGRVDLNSAPASLLQGLGLSSEATQKLDDLRASGHRLASVDALRVDDILAAQELEALDTRELTVYSSAPLNLNEASPRVLAAAFGISPEEAEALAGKRPFVHWADTLQKVGREPATFNLDVAPFAPREQPPSVAFESSCFRLVSAATLDMPGGDHRPVHAAVEAVVAFEPDGRYHIRFWRELRGADARIGGEEPSLAAASSNESANDNENAN